MANRRTISRDDSNLPSLLVSREEAKQRLGDQITRGRALLKRLDEGVEALKTLPPEKGFIRSITEGHPKHDLGMSIREEHEIWMKYIQTLFAATFDEGQYYSEFLHERAKPHIGSVTDYYGGFFRRFLRRQVATLVSIKERVSLLDEPAAIVSDNNAAPTSVVSARNVFIVHGRDRGVRETVARFVEHLGLHAVILDEIPNLGRTVVEKFEQAAAEHNVRYAIVLMTPDDVGALAIEVDESSPRARQNVIFELGYFIGKLGRGNVCPLVKGDVEIPSDFYGVVYVPLDDFDGWKSKLKSEMEAVGLPIHEAS